MTARFDVERQLATWLEATRPMSAPEGLLRAVERGVAETPRRPGVLIPGRWTWRHEARLRTVARTVVLAAVVAALVATAVTVAAFLGSPRPAPPFGLTTAGLIAVDTPEGIVVTRADGTERQLLVPADGQIVNATWSRDGLHLAFWRRPERFGPWRLVVVDADGRNEQVLAEGVSLALREQELHQPSNLTWSPDSRRIAFAADAGGPGAGTSIFVAALGRTGTSQITDPGQFAIDPAWSSNDVIAFRSDVTDTIHAVRPDGSGERRLSDLDGATLWLDWSPDGSRLAAAIGLPEGADIFVLDADGTGARDVSNEQGTDLSPAWSPDGSSLAWARASPDGTGPAHVVVADPDGPNVVEIRVPADLAPPVWSPDGTRIYSYRLGTDGEFESLVVLDPAGVAPPVLLPADGNVGNGNWQRLP